MSLQHLVKRSVTLAILFSVLGGMSVFYPTASVQAAASPLDTLKSLSQKYGDGSGAALMAASKKDLEDLSKAIGDVQTTLTDIKSKYPPIKSSHWIKTHFYDANGAMEVVDSNNAYKNTQYLSLAEVLQRIRPFTIDFYNDNGLKTRTGSPSGREYAAFLADNYSALYRYISSNTAARDGRLPAVNFENKTVFEMPDADPNNELLKSYFNGLGDPCTSDQIKRTPCGDLLAQDMASIKNKEKDLTLGHRTDDAFLFMNDTGSYHFHDADWKGVKSYVENLNSEIADPWQKALTAFIEINADLVKKTNKLIEIKDGKTVVTPLGHQRFVDLEKNRQDIKRRISASTKAYNMLATSYQDQYGEVTSGTWWGNTQSAEMQLNPGRPVNLEDSIAKGNSEVYVVPINNQTCEYDNSLCIFKPNLTTGDLSYTSMELFVTDYKRLEALTEANLTNIKEADAIAFLVGLSHPAANGSISPNSDQTPTYDPCATNPPTKLAIYNPLYQIQYAFWGNLCGSTVLVSNLISMLMCSAASVLQTQAGVILSTTAKTPTSNLQEVERRVGINKDVTCDLFGNWSESDLIAPVQDVVVANGGFGKLVQGIYTNILRASNVVLIIFFIFLALVNILQLEVNTYALNKVLPGLIIAFLLAHASMFVIRAALEVTDKIGTEILSIGSANGNRGASFDSFIIAFSSFPYPVQTPKDDKGNYIGGIQAIAQKSDKDRTPCETYPTKEGDTLPGFMTIDCAGIYVDKSKVFMLFINNVFSLIAALLVLVLAVQFVLRRFVFFALIPFAPLAILCNGIPPAKGLWTKWWKTFSGWVFMPLVACFWLWVALLWFNTTIVNGSLLTTIFSYVLGMAALYAAIKSPASFVGDVKFAGEAMNKWTGWAAEKPRASLGKVVKNNAMDKLGGAALVRGYNQYFAEPGKAWEAGIYKGAVLRERKMREGKIKYKKNHQTGKMEIDYWHEDDEEVKQKKVVGGRVAVANEAKRVESPRIARINAIRIADNARTRKYNAFIHGREAKRDQTTRRDKAADDAASALARNKDKYKDNEVQIGHLAEMTKNLNDAIKDEVDARRLSTQEYITEMYHYRAMAAESKAAPLKADTTINPTPELEAAKALLNHETHENKLAAERYENSIEKLRLSNLEYTEEAANAEKRTLRSRRNLAEMQAYQSKKYYEILTEQKTIEGEDTRTLRTQIEAYKIATGKNEQRFIRKSNKKSQIAANADDSLRNAISNAEFEDKDHMEKIAAQALLLQEEYKEDVAALVERLKNEDNPAIRENLEANLKNLRNAVTHLGTLRTNLLAQAEAGTDFSTTQLNKDFDLYRKKQGLDSTFKVLIKESHKAARKTIGAEDKTRAQGRLETGEFVRDGYEALAETRIAYLLHQTGFGDVAQQYGEDGSEDFLDAIKVVHNANASIEHVQGFMAHARGVDRWKTTADLAKEYEEKEKKDLKPEERKVWEFAIKNNLVEKRLSAQKKATKLLIDELTAARASDSITEAEYRRFMVDAQGNQLDHFDENNLNLIYQAKEIQTREPSLNRRSVLGKLLNNTQAATVAGFTEAAQDNAAIARQTTTNQVVIDRRKRLAETGDTAAPLPPPQPKENKNNKKDQDEVEAAEVDAVDNEAATAEPEPEPAPAPEPEDAHETAH